MSDDDRYDAFGNPLEEQDPPSAPAGRRGKLVYPETPDFAHAPLGSEWDVAGRGVLRAIAVWETGDEEARRNPEFIRAQIALVIFDTPRAESQVHQWFCVWPSPDEPDGEPFADLTPMVAEDAGIWRELAPDALRRWDGLWPEGGSEPIVTRPGGLSYHMEPTHLTLERLDGPLPEALRSVRRALDLEPMDLPSGQPVLDGAHWILCSEEGEPVASYVEDDSLWRPLPGGRPSLVLPYVFVGAMFLVLFLLILSRS